MRNKGTEFLIAVILLILIVAGGATALQIYNRQAAEQTMDRIEMRYDADGPFILIDSSSGLIGVYNASDVIGHIWTKDAIESPAGVYSLVIYSDRIGLGRPETEWIHEIRIKKKDMNIIFENMQPGIPVLVF